MNWECDEVAHWLSTINCPQYITLFLEQFIEGNILLNDINTDILVSELDVRKVHSSKIMREIYKLKKHIKNNVNHSCFEIEHKLNTYHIHSTFEEHSILVHNLHLDLSSERLKTQQLTIDIARLQSNIFSDDDDLPSSPPMHLQQRSHSADLSRNNSYTLFTPHDDDDDDRMSRKMKHNLRDYSPPSMPDEHISNEMSIYLKHIQQQSKHNERKVNQKDLIVKKQFLIITEIQNRYKKQECSLQETLKRIGSLIRQKERREKRILVLRQLLNTHNIQLPKEHKRESSNSSLDHNISMKSNSILSQSIINTNSFSSNDQLYSPLLISPVSQHVQQPHLSAEQQQLFDRQTARYYKKNPSNTTLDFNHNRHVSNVSSMVSVQSGNSGYSTHSYYSNGSGIVLNNGSVSGNHYLQSGMNGNQRRAHKKKKRSVKKVYQSDTHGSHRRLQQMQRYKSPKGRKSRSPMNNHRVSYSNTISYENGGVRMRPSSSKNRKKKSRKTKIRLSNNNSVNAKSNGMGSAVSGYMSGGSIASSIQSAPYDSSNGLDNNRVRLGNEFVSRSHSQPYGHQMRSQQRNMRVLPGIDDHNVNNGYIASVTNWACMLIVLCAFCV